MTEIVPARFPKVSPAAEKLDLLATNSPAESILFKVAFCTGDPACPNRVCREEAADQNLINVAIACAMILTGSTECQGCAKHRYQQHAMAGVVCTHGNSFP